MNVGNLDRRVTIEQKVVTRDASYGTEVATWAVVAVVWAQVQDELPSRSEAVKQGLAVSSRRCRVRMRYRTDLDSAMRLRVDGRTLQIVGGPSELGAREWTELMCEEYSS